MDGRRYFKKFHDCDVQYFICDGTPKTKPNLSFNKKAIRWFRKVCLLSKFHPKTKYFFRSYLSYCKERQRQFKEHPYTIHPFSAFRIIWQFIITIVLFLVLPTDVYVSAFFNITQGETHNKVRVLYNLSTVLNFICVLDIIINFFTGYEDRKLNIILDNEKIFFNYLYSYFFIDLIAVAEIVDSFYHNISYVYFLNILEMIRIIKFKYILTNIKIIYDFFGISHLWYTVMYYAVISAAYVHYHACILLILAKINDPDISQKLNAIDGRIYYMLSVLNVLNRFSEGTAHKNVNKTIFKTISKVFGLFMGAFFFIKLIEWVYSLFYASLKYEANKIKIEKYIAAIGLQPHIKEKMLNCYEYKFKKKYFNEQGIFRNFSIRQQSELLFEELSKFIENFQVFEDITEMQISLLFKYSNRLILPPGSILYVSSHDVMIYFVMMGTLAAYDKNGEELFHYEEGQSFGHTLEYEEFVDTTNEIKVVAIEMTNVLGMRFIDFNDIFNIQPELKKQYNPLRIMKEFSVLSFDTIN